jgi:hypothetical protein
VADPAALAAERVTLVVQVDGRRLALRSGNVRRHLGGREPVKVVHVPDRLINLVTSGR